MLEEKEVLVVMVAFALTLAAFSGVLYNYFSTSVGGERGVEIVEKRVELDGLRKVYVLRFNKDVSLNDISVTLSYRRGERVFSLFENCSVGGRFFLFSFDGFSSTVCVGYNVIVKYVPDLGLSISFEAGGKEVMFAGRNASLLTSFGKEVFLSEGVYPISDFVYVVCYVERLNFEGQTVYLKCFLQNSVRDPMPIISVPVNSVLGSRILARSVVEVVVFGDGAAETSTFLNVGGNRFSLG